MSKRTTLTSDEAGSAPVNRAERRSRLTPEQRRLRAKIAADTRWSREDPRESGLRANAGLQAKFEREVRAEFPDLPEAEIQRRAQCAFRAHMNRLALLSSKARSRRSPDDGGRAA